MERDETKEIMEHISLLKGEGTVKQRVRRKCTLEKMNRLYPGKDE